MALFLRAHDQGGLDPGGTCIGGGDGVGETSPPIGYYGIPSTSGWYASYWNAFLYLQKFCAVRINFSKTSITTITQQTWVVLMQLQIWFRGEDVREAQPPLHPILFSFSYSFQKISCQMIGYRPPLGLEPHLRNPGSTTVMESVFTKKIQHFKATFYSLLKLIIFVNDE